MNGKPLPSAATSHTRGDRRVALRAFYANAALWGLGNGLVGSSLVVYLAGTYGAKGFAVSLILAAPRLVGVLRLATPVLMQKVGDVRRFCCAIFLASAVVLGLLPGLTAPWMWPSTGVALTVLVATWTCYHLLEFLGTIALWAWIGELVPRRIRGRFVGRRAGVLNVCQVLGMLLGAAGTMWAADDEKLRWWSYVACVVAGAWLFGLAVWPLWRTPTTCTTRSAQASAATSWREILAPFTDANFRRYLAYGGWFSLANGITSPAQFLFQMRVLNFSYAERLALDGSSQGLQSVVMPWVGKVIDRRGNVPVLVVSQLLVAVGMVFFLIATPAARWWVAGAYLFWVAYAGVNVAMPNLVLTLARRSYASYAAAWFAWTQLAYAAATLAGGLLVDWASQHWSVHNWLGLSINHYAAIFLLGFLLRAVAALLAGRVKE